MRRLQLMSAKLVLLLLAAGLGLAQTTLAWERGLPPTEVFAPFLYIPVLAAAVLGGWMAGLATAGLASLFYGVALSDQSQAGGLGLFLGLLVDRAATYCVYAVVAAFISGYVERRLEKLERFDRIDDATGLANSADFLEESELEMKRADRYGSHFAIAEVRLDTEVLRRTSRKQRARLLRLLGTTLKASTRRVDRPARIHDDALERFVIILPETGSEGSHVLAGRLDTAVRTALETNAVHADGHLEVRTLAYPEDRLAIEDLRAASAVIDAERRVISLEEMPA